MSLIDGGGNATISVIFFYIILWPMFLKGKEETRKQESSELGGKLMQKISNQTKILYTQKDKY